MELSTENCNYFSLLLEILFCILCLVEVVSFVKCLLLVSLTFANACARKGKRFVNMTRYGDSIVKQLKQPGISSKKAPTCMDTRSVGKAPNPLPPSQDPFLKKTESV